MTRTAAPRRSHDFDPERYRSELGAIIHEVAALPLPGGGEAKGSSDERAANEEWAANDAALDGILRRHPRDGCGFFSRSELIAGFRHLAQRGGLGKELDEAGFLQRVRRRPVRSSSGVTPVTVFTRPHPCPGRCIFCPNDVRMPKSYLSDEPGAQRAADHRFDPYLQTWNRLAAFAATGHPTDKVELIVLGGTWSFYGKPYQRWFAKRVFDALNDFGSGVDERTRSLPTAPDTSALPARLDGHDHRGDRYNRLVGAWLREGVDGASLGGADAESASWRELEAAQRENEAAGARCVGLVLETRPDCVDGREVHRLRRLGATKIQIGIQSLRDDVLAANRRGHDVASTRRALQLLRAAGFKIHAHWMPNLLGATPASDVEDVARLFDDPAWRPDELKVYPCSLVASAELVQHYERGEWRPYEYEELLEVLVAALERAPRWCRLTRVVRDISSDDILVGNKLTNFREIAERELAERGGRGRDIRAREVRRARVDVGELALRVSEYASSVGEELFFEFVTATDRIAAFLRLALPSSDTPCPDELRGAALIRELHVYGASQPIGARSAGPAQHRGLGGTLLREAEERARAAGYSRIAVISAVGTRAYYRARGYEVVGLYCVRALG